MFTYRSISARSYARLLGLLGLLLAAPSHAGQPGEKPAEKPGEAPRAYHPVVLADDGTAPDDALAAASKRVRRDLRAGRQGIVVLLHGFDQTEKKAGEEYQDISKRLLRATEELESTPSILGLHWSSDAGAQREWLAKAAGSRLLSLLGFKKAIPNPYLEKTELAHRVGATGFRALAFRLQNDFPGVPIHVFAHSMGAQVVVSALAPASSGNRNRGAQLAVEQPERRLELGLVALAGADLDHDIFCRPGNTMLARALRHAQVWWVTVPEKNQADGVLELRRGVGKGDALGNRGFKLRRADLDRLLSRRGLVLDEGNIPIGHIFREYYNDLRLGELARALLYLREPTQDGAARSVLARLDGVLLGSPAGDLPLEAKPAPAEQDRCVQMYERWMVEPRAPEYGLLSVAGYREDEDGRTGRRRRQDRGDR
ncbi:MAG: alpha/beta hydrolase [Armatimonadota bacterium]